MADETVLCRRKDDHSITHVIPVAALGYFPDWEPIPEPEPAPRAAGEAAEGGEAETPKTGGKTPRKTDSKGRGE